MSPKPVYKVLDYGSMRVRLEGYSFTVEEWKKAEENETRTKVIVEDALFIDILGILIRFAISRRDDVIGTLLQSTQFHDRARLAYLLEIIDKRAMQDLLRIHNIRNKWAHLAEPVFSAKEWKRDVLALSTVGSKKDEVTKKNYMDFFWDAVQESRRALLDAATRVNPTCMQIVNKLHEMKVKPEDLKVLWKEASRHRAKEAL